MDVKVSSTPGRSYEDFQPPLEWTRTPPSDTLRLDLPAGFKREHLSVQLDSNLNLRIRGECPISDNKSIRFFKEVQTPVDCNTKEIRARFENGSLSVVLPKTIKQEITPEPLSPLSTPTDEYRKSPKTQQKPDSADDYYDARAKPGLETTGKETSATTSAEKKKNGSTDAATRVTGEVKKDDEKASKEAAKTVDEAGGELVKESYMHGGGGLLLGMDRSRQLMVNVIVAFVVVVALLMYTSSMFTS